MYRDSHLPSSTTEALISQHAPLVKRIAYHLIARLPDTVDVDDLIQAGMLGLLDAIHHYNQNQGASFETYAGIRIRGAMLDEIRRNDWAPRSVHKKSRDIAETIQMLEQQLGRPPQDRDIAQAMNLSLEDYHQLLNEAAGHQVFSLDIFNDNDEIQAQPITAVQTGPADMMQADRFHHALTQAIQALPDRERLLMSLYYNDELNLKEIGEVLGVSESRVSQLHSQAILRLRAKLTDWIQ